MIIYNNSNSAKKDLNSVFFKFRFLFLPILLFTITFFFFFGLGEDDSIKAELDIFNPVTNVGGDAGRAIFDSLGGLGPGLGQFTNLDGTPMTEEQLVAAIEAYVESIAGQDLSDEAVVAGFYASLGISDVPADATTPEFVALATALNEARSGDKTASRALAESIAAAAKAAAEDSAPPETGEQPMADASKEGAADPKKDGENPTVVTDLSSEG